MKLIIFEGLDNIGKSTVINAYKDRLIESDVPENEICIIHFDHPRGSTREEMIRNIDLYNTDLCNKIIEFHKENRYRYCFLDRSWYSEYVYGIIYRKRDKQELLDNIHKIESDIIDNISPDNITFIRLSCDNLNFVVKHEDGKSLSNVDDTARKWTLISTEDVLFNEITDKSILPDKCKGTIIINDGMNYEDINITVTKAENTVNH